MNALFDQVRQRAAVCQAFDGQSYVLESIGWLVESARIHSSIWRREGGQLLRLQDGAVVERYEFVRRGGFTVYAAFPPSGGEPTAWYEINRRALCERKRDWKSDLVLQENWLVRKTDDLPSRVREQLPSELLPLVCIWSEKPYGLFVELFEDQSDLWFRSRTLSRHRGLHPGSLLSALIWACGFKEYVSCGCHAFRQQMNRWGWWGCWRRRQEIYDWLAVKAAERGILIDQAAFWPLFRQAIRQAAARSPHSVR